MFDFVLKGANASQLEKDIGSDLFPANEHYFGLVNVSFAFNSVTVVLTVGSIILIGFRNLDKFFDKVVHLYLLSQKF